MKDQTTCSCPTCKPDNVIDITQLLSTPESRAEEKEQKQRNKLKEMLRPLLED